MVMSMSNFIHYEHLEDYEEQIRKANAYDKFKEWLEDQMTPKTDAWGDTGYTHMIKCDYILKKLEDFKEDADVQHRGENEI